MRKSYISYNRTVINLYVGDNMKHIVCSLFMFLFSYSSYATECSEDSEIIALTSPCQMSYYKFAPKCEFGDGLCLSLVLQGLVNKNLFDYRADVRAVYNTPLKRKMFKRTSEYKNLYQQMMLDLKEAQKSTFCAEMDTYWLYDLRHKGFSFLPHSIIPKGKLYRITNISKVIDYDFVYIGEKDAIEIENWESVAYTKFVFFKLKGKPKGYIPIKIERFAWFIPSIRYDFEGTIQITYDEGCRIPAYYDYRVK